MGRPERLRSVVALSQPQISLTVDSHLKATSEDGQVFTILGDSPVILTSFLRNQDELQEPPRKRTRAEGQYEFIPIARQRLIFVSGNLRNLTASNQHFARSDAGRFLKFRFSESPAGIAPVQHLSITSLLRTKQSKGSLESLRLDFVLGRRVLSRSLSTILNVLNRQDNEQGEGRLWTEVDFTSEEKAGVLQVQFTFELRWNTSTTVPYGLRMKKDRRFSQLVLETFFPAICSDGGKDQTKLIPQAFYEAAFITDEGQRTTLLSSSVPGLTAKLYPFQKRALQWLLRREGVEWDGADLEGQPIFKSCTDTTPGALPLSFVNVPDVNRQDFYISGLHHAVARDVSPFQRCENSLRGGILAEEMGLGKTVETIALILMHSLRNPPTTMLDPHSGQHLRPTRASLIVTPISLHKQWLSEFSKHAPGLRVMVYEGLKHFRGTEEDIVTAFTEQDVVVTTYSVLQAEIHFAETPPDRSMRYERVHKRPKSPLVQLLWWRVCLDEAQQIESGVSNAARVARLIPRINAWGVTGTPVKENIKDLWGLLLFLRYEPFASVYPSWEGVISTHKGLFEALFRRFALRHTKRAVRKDLELPPQKRYVITMPFSAVEEQHYQSLFADLAQNCGLDAKGAPLLEDWDPQDPETIDTMKQALSQLRQIVLHPEVGPRRLRAAATKNRPLRTIQEVLDAMIEQADIDIRTSQRTVLVNKLRRGQLLENTPRVKEALTIWTEVLAEAETLVEECRIQLAAEIQRAKENGNEDDQYNTADTDEYSDDNEDEDGKKESSRLGDCRRRLRSALDILHRATFFRASAHFQIKSNEEWTSPDSEEFKTLEKLEIDGYEEAKQIRKQILQEAHAKAYSYMKKLEKGAASQSFVVIPEFKPVVHKGLESRRILEKMEDLFGILDEQANLIDDWREQVVQILIKPLVDEEGEVEITGDEYEDSTKIQEDLMAFTTVLRAAIADRQDAFTGLVNERTRYETLTAERMAKDDEGPCPQKFLALLELRKSSKPTEEQGSFRGIITDLRELVVKLRHDGTHRARVELDLVQEQLKLAQDQMTEQSKAAAALEKELGNFTAAMNARVEYYRQLQELSDTVAVLTRPEGKERVVDEDALAELGREEEPLRQKIALSHTRHRYLLHLKESGENSSEPKFCVICQTSFTLGVLTICGHQFCKDCIMLWFKAHHNCPVCKRRLSQAMLHDISLKPQELRLHKDSTSHFHEPESPQRSKKTGIYSEFSSEKLAAIKNIELDGPSFATKVDTLVRHLLWLRTSDPGAKSIIFSQFKGFFEVLSNAFDRYRIGYSSFDKRDGITRFKEDPGIECFLMDARAHASGLNLVNASHVFLCEPVLNTALELQAIARVDRIGQEHETTVWLYLVEGTVEESIYNLSVKRRMEHMGQATKGKSKESTPEVSDLNLEAANSMELQQAALSKLMSKDKNLGENVDTNDLWDCLFGHLQKDSTEDATDDVRFNNPAVMGYLAAEAAEERRRGQDTEL